MCHINVPFVNKVHLVFISVVANHWEFVSIWSVSVWSRHITSFLLFLFICVQLSVLGFVALSLFTLFTYIYVYTQQPEQLYIFSPEIILANTNFLSSFSFTINKSSQKILVNHNKHNTWLCTCSLSACLLSSSLRSCSISS